MTRVATDICIWSTSTHTKFSTIIYTNFLNLVSNDIGIVLSKVDLQLNRLMNPMPAESDAHAVYVYVYSQVGID